ncbi:MAG TPA: hypothetical protein VK801_03485 [Caulobacteraceae bacterium]|jgi:hypothetical protein|nr:hypothetical protein [Caulobacteraceae bacterium]
MRFMLALATAGAARTTVQIADLASPGLLVEIEADVVKTHSLPTKIQSGPEYMRSA